MGTTFREYIEEKGNDTEMRGVVTDFVANEQIAMYLEGKCNTVKVSFTFEDRGDVTWLSQDAKIHFKGLLKITVFLFGPAFKKKILEQARNEFARPNELCERDVAS